MSQFSGMNDQVQSGPRPDCPFANRPLIDDLVQFYRSGSLESDANAERAL